FISFFLRTRRSPSSTLFPTRRSSDLGHSYWILLTIIVILKPTFSLTRKRNFQRLIGTIAGALFGVLILFLFKDRTMLFVWMLVLDRKSTRLNSSHVKISYAVFCLKQK